MIITDFPFKHGVSFAEKDKKIFGDWEDGKLKTEDAILMLFVNNEIPKAKQYYMSPRDFANLAGSLGYKRKSGR